MTKDNLRQSILQRRAQLDPGLAEEYSRQVWERLQGLPAFPGFRRLLFYASFKSEVATFAMIDECLKRGLQVALPRAEPGTRGLAFHSIANTADLEAGPYGILQPPAQAAAAEPAAFDAILVPAAVFDERGHRIGYGGGYYDRFFAKAGNSLLRIGLAYDFQVVPRIPEEAHDAAMHYIITEKRVLRPGDHA